MTKNQPTKKPAIKETLECLEQSKLQSVNGGGVLTLPVGAPETKP